MSYGSSAVYLMPHDVPAYPSLQTSKAGVAIGKLRNHVTPGVSTLAKEIVKSWKDAVEDKRKRKREDGESKGDATKRVKAEGQFMPV